ncbi:Glycoside hydrolase superfamily [Acididesulfobacillus acetoxydans]|uniref:Glycoside hydrolase superfamily n=1 Tax=Acididesulfobacillus acetoxydans TaxID=1561005 RepID=A0A8S0WLB4_9FIRM|nr:glycosyl hydrolase family 18 protein [Acididesulfobacillus acetoxydans]CAA7599934.1 Glycoside hydrolase superfamily [Acididesulfobacillus acetoxydans]CEJ07974.1 Spore germination protein YaaH [Acididesulfobacillus acetoxydans]
MLKHVVRTGESLWSIAQLFGSTVTAIAKANGLSNPDLIYPGQTLIIPHGTLPKLEVNAYLTDFGPLGQETLRKHTEFLTYLSPFSYQVQSDGSLRPIPDRPLTAAAQAAGVFPLMVITNLTDNGFDSEIAHSVLNDASLQDVLVGKILASMESQGYRGLNVDFEYVFPSDRQAYNAFLEHLAPRLHARHYLLSSALAPKLRTDQPGLLYEAHDYRAHGQIVDFTVLMTYEWGWAGGPPLAISPLNMIKKVLDYAVTVIPREKILMGIMLSGRDWTLPYVEGGPYAQTFSPEEAVARAAEHGAVIHFDPASQSPYYHYYDAEGREHEVWFEDTRSLQAKFQTAIAYHLRGISYWTLIPSFPQLWLTQEDTFTTIHR